MTGDPLLLRLQLQLCRDFTTDRLNAKVFIDRFLWLNHVDNKIPQSDDVRLDAWIGDAYLDIDLHNEYDDLREPDEYDDNQLRAAISKRLRRWDAGTYPPPST